jgi:hypothetical protein
MVGGRHDDKIPGPADTARYREGAIGGRDN